MELTYLVFLKFHTKIRLERVAVNDEMANLLLLLIQTFLNVLHKLQFGVLCFTTRILGMFVS